jgi:acetyltransferase
MKAETPSSFPIGHGQTTITTRRGRDVIVRHMHVHDDALLVDLFHHFSEDTRRMRFFSPLPDLPDTIVWREAHRLADINPRYAAALIALDAAQGYAIGVARIAIDIGIPTSAELAIVLRDDYQGEGIGTILFDLLVQVALVRGIKRLRALSLAENAAVHRLIDKLGMPYTSETRHGETTTVIALAD